MSERYRVYTKILRCLKQLLPTQKQGHVVTLCMMIAGIVMGKKAQLSAMSSEIPYSAKDSSIEMRMRRFVKNKGISDTIYFLPFASELLASLSGESLVFAMDASAVGRGCMVLMIGVLYKNRMIPIAWVVYKGKKGHASAETHQEVLEKLKPLIPEGADVILLGDGEYDTTQMMKWVKKETNWHFVVRTALSSMINCEGEWLSCQQLNVARGNTLSVPEVKFTIEHEHGPLHAIAWWKIAYEQPIYLLTNFELAEEACYFYARRFKIETMFSDKKSRGFHIHKSHLSDPKRISNLLIAASLAYIWMIYLGVDVISRGKRGLIDRTDRIDKSLFRLGMDWLKYILKYGLPIPIQFGLPLIPF